MRIVDYIIAKKIDLSIDLIKFFLTWCKTCLYTNIIKNEKSFTIMKRWKTLK